MKRLSWLAVVWSGVALGCGQTEERGAGAGGLTSVGEAGAPSGEGGARAGAGNGAGAGAGSGGIASSAGGGGCAVADPEPIDVSHCDVLPFARSTCGAAETREALRCGEPGSILDESCCLRAVCDDDADCGDDARCIPRVNQAPDAFGGTSIEECASGPCGSCDCSVTDDIDLNGYCIPVAPGFEGYDCDLSGRSCEELRQWRGHVGSFDELVGGSSAPLSVLEARMDACVDAIDRELVRSCGEASCTCQDGDCSIPGPLFCPFEDVLGCPLTLEAALAPAALCERDVDRAVYSECADQSVRLRWTEGGENTYELVFSRASGNLLAGRANGYVAGLCALEPGSDVSVRTGPLPSSSSCQSCRFCGATPGAEPDPVPECVFDSAGRVALPP